MKYFILILVIHCSSFFGFSQESKDSLMQLNIPKPIRVEIVKKQTIVKEQTINGKEKQSVAIPEEKRASLKNSAKNNNLKKPENLRIEGK
jgi:hypothetical protein